MIDANIFPLTIMVYVSSFSVDIKLPNQDRFVNSGDVVSTVGVGGTEGSSETEREYRRIVELIPF